MARASVPSRIKVDAEAAGPLGPSLRLNSATAKLMAINTFRSGCYSFSSARPVSSITITFPLFSEQQLVDCTYLAGFDSCPTGGVVEYGWNLIKSRGIESSSTYPYTSGVSWMHSN